MDSNHGFQPFQPWIPTIPTMDSNHPPPIIRELPISVNKRINSLSCNKEVFYNAAPLYNHALKHSNFDFHLNNESPPTHHKARRTREERAEQNASRGGWLSRFLTCAAKFW